MLWSTFNIFVHIFDDAGQGGHVLLVERHAQVVADEVVPRLEHGGGDEVQDAGGQAEKLEQQREVMRSEQRNMDHTFHQQHRSSSAVLS